MPAIAWTDALSVGVSALDKDHKTLIRMIDELDQEGLDFVALFGAVLDYTCGHFDREEAYLEGIGYPALDDHHLRHEEFAAQVADLLRQYREEPSPAAGVRLKDILWDWLRSHIMVEDLRYAQWARDR